MLANCTREMVRHVDHGCGGGGVGGVGGRVTSTPLGRDRFHRAIERWASSRQLWNAVLPAALLALQEELARQDALPE
jgi:hypothetical protein